MAMLHNSQQIGSHGVTRRLSVLEDRTVERDDIVEVRQLVQSLFRKKWLVFAVFTLVTALTVLWALLQDPKYTTSATLLLDPREQHVISSQDQVVADLKLNNPLLESEVAILQSSALLANVISEIGIDRFDVIDPALTPPSLFDQGVGLIKQLVRGDGSDGRATGGLVSPEVIRENRVIATIQRGLIVRRLGDSYVIEVSVTTTDPVLSTEIANSLARNYIGAQLADRKRVAADATSWLADQVEILRIELAETEAEVERFRTELLVESGASEVVLQQQLAELARQIALVRSDLSIETARLARINATLEENGVAAAAEVLASGFLDGLRERRAALLIEDANLAITQGESHPDRLSILSEIDQIDLSIAAEVRIIAQGHQNEIDILSRREQALQSEMTEIETRLSGIATSSLRLRELEREAEARRIGFEDVLGRLGETRAQVELQRAEAKLVNTAQIPLSPSSPRILLLAVFGASIGLSLGLFLALSVEVLAPGFGMIADLERATGLPVIASIPRERFRNPHGLLRFLDESIYSPMTERIRQLRITLTLNAKPDKPLSIVILSSVKNEGKTTTALALAKSFADAGRRTILVDLDTRRSEVLLGLRQNTYTGIDDWWRGTANLSDTIIPLDDRGSLYICGTHRNNALLADGVNALQIDRLFSTLGERFDVIIADSPPVLAVADGLAIARAVDDILYVVRFKTTSRRSVRYGLSMLKNLGLRPTGLVMTVADVDSDPDVYDYSYQG